MFLKDHYTVFLGISEKKLLEESHEELSVEDTSGEILKKKLGE